MSAEVFKEQWQEQIITFLPNKDFTRRNETKGSFTKFFRYITTQKKMLTYVFIMSILVMIINVSGSLIFQYVVYDVEESASSGGTQSAVVGEESESSTAEPARVHVSDPEQGKTGKIMLFLKKWRTSSI